MTILELLKIYFSKLCNGKDTRQPKKCHYLMENLLIIMELAILAGYDTTNSVTSFVDIQIDVLAKVGLIENNELPDENTYYRTLQMIPWETLKSLSNRIYSNLPKGIQERIKKNGISVVIDGKFIRGNKTRTKDKTYVGTDIVSLYDVETSVILSQDIIEADFTRDKKRL